MRAGVRRREFVGLAALLLAACGGGTGDGPATEPVHRFSFVAIADPHLYGSLEAETRLQACLDWIAAHEEDEEIHLVFVLGDLGSHLARARELLGALPVPWIPVIGDNAIQAGQEAEFDAVLAPRYAALATTLDGWHQAPTPTWNPDTGADSHFQNFSFDHEDVHFVGLDGCTRTVGGLAGEQADLHAFPGGTWPFFQADLDACPKPRRENVVLLSHHPMHALLGGLGAFSSSERDRIESFTKTHRDHVYADFAGHYHFNWHDAENEGGFEVFVTDATHEDDVTLRLVRVLDDGTTFTYAHALVVVPW